MIGIGNTFNEYLGRCAAALDQVDPGEAIGLVECLVAAHAKQRLVFVCGNGGSAANASHFAEDLGKSSLSRQEWDEDCGRRFRVLSLTDNASYLLAWANDAGFERIFIEQLKNLASAGDVLLALSGSGNSDNVLTAVDWANRHGLVTWGLTGFDGGQLGSLAQHGLHVPANDMGQVESCHLLIFHWVMEEATRRIRAAPGGGRHVDGRWEAAACAGVT